MDLRHILLFFHILSAVIWIGGIIFLSIAGPVLRSAGQREGSKLLHAMGRRFRNVSWVAVIVLLVTGMGNLHFLGFFSNPSNFVASHPSFTWKIIIVSIMIVNKTIHDFVVGPKARGYANIDTTKRQRIWKAALWMGRANVILGVLVIYLAVLVRG